MSFFIKTAKTIRNNWKKSIFAALASTYAYNYTKNYLQIQDLMRAYCKKASEYGNQTIPISIDPRTVTVILNPKSNKRKANEEFEKYCAPMLHLAGISVDVIQTESEGHAKSLIQDLNSTGAIVIAGGDGTVSEVITGLLRRTNENTDGLVPVGVLPLGQVNTIATNLFESYNGKVQKVQRLAEATMAVIEETTKPLDVMKVEIIEENSSESKPIYALSEIKWGAYRDTEIKKDNYWYYGKFRKYAAYVFNGYKNNLTWNCDAQITYTPPCNGCNNCTLLRNTSNNKWYHKFSRPPSVNHNANIINNECSLVNEQKISTIDFSVKTSNILPENERIVPKLELSVGPKTIDYLEFVKQGWRWENKGERDVREVINARTVELRPQTHLSGSEMFFSIDNEQYEVKPIRITLLPKVIKVFCRKDEGEK